MNNDEVDDFELIATKKVIPIVYSRNLHTCPFKTEIHSNYELCDCDEAQRHECAMDV